MMMMNTNRNGSPLLTQKHLDDLRNSGLDDSTIKACGFYSLQTPAGIQKVLRWQRYSGELGDCLAIPFGDANGQRNGYVRLKPDRPRLNKEAGKPVKYESPKGYGNRAYFPPGVPAVLSDNTVSLVIVEGEKKAAKASQDGFPTVGLVGVYGWQKKRPRDASGTPEGERQLIDDLAGIAWQGRSIFICFDSDAATNPNVRHAEYHLAETLTRHGAIVKIVRLPPDGAKVGLDDFLVANGADAFRQLLSEATVPTPPEKGPRESVDDPHRLARLYIKSRCLSDGLLTLRFWRGEFLRWGDGAYRAIPEEELAADLAATIKDEFDRVNKKSQKHSIRKFPALKVSRSLIGNVRLALSGLTLLPFKTEPPAWLSDDSPFSADEILPCKNALVHLPSLVAGKAVYSVKPTPNFFCQNCLDVELNPEAAKPSAWLEFLSQLWPDDAPSIGTLQEWFGYLLTPDTRQQKIFMLVGPRRGGKGTIARVIRALVGERNVCCPTLSGLGQNFGLWPLIGKTAAIVSDARLSSRADGAAVVERLLSISGEDAQTIDRKFLSPVTCRLPTRFMLLTNELPRLGDSSGALPGRMILLRLTHSWYGNEDTGLTDRLLAELPGILWWAIAGWKRLRERGRFVQPDSSLELLDELESLASPVGAFISDCCHVAPGCQVERTILFSKWKWWCEAQGRDHPGDAAGFGRNLRAAVPTIGSAHPRVNGQKVRTYEGIGLK